MGSGLKGPPVVRERGVDGMSPPLVRKHGVDGMSPLVPAVVMPLLEPPGVDGCREDLREGRSRRLGDGWWVPLLDPSACLQLRSIESRASHRLGSMPLLFFLSQKCWTPAFNFFLKSLQLMFKISMGSLDLTGFIHTLATKGTKSGFLTQFRSNLNYLFCI